MVRKRLLSTAFALVAAATIAHAAAPAQTVDIKLQDTSTDTNALQGMQIVLDHDTVKPGRVTLRASNLSKTLVHEVIVAHDPGKKALPYDAQRDEVIEKRVHPLGEIGDLPPGKSGTLTLDLKPGRYLLFCNEAGHYKAGMVATLVVAR
jgi:uncharacterized cupredoxin-like copper-binding protein